MEEGFVVSAEVEVRVSYQDGREGLETQLMNGDKVATCCLAIVPEILSRSHSGRSGLPVEIRNSS
jgi:hypothetical protein